MQREWAALQARASDPRQRQRVSGGDGSSAGVVAVTISDDGDARAITKGRNAREAPPSRHEEAPQEAPRSPPAATLTGPVRGATSPWDTSRSSRHARETNWSIG